MIALTDISLALPGGLLPVLARLGLTLVHSIWEGTLVAALLWVSLANLRGRSPQIRYLASCVAALAMMGMLVLTFLLVLASGTLPLSPSSERGRNGVAAAAASDASSPAGSSAESGMSVPSVSRPQPAAVKRPFLTEGRKLLVTWGQRGATLLPSLALAWAVGVLALAGRLIVGYVGVRQLRSHGTSPVEPCWQQRLLALARRMRIDQPVSLRQSAGVTTPAVVGWLRPVILLPVGMCAGLSTAQVEMILAHELAHVGRQDYLVNLLLNLVETVLFYHPAIWWIAARVREERENACDDLALAASDDDRLGYARALASLEEMRLPLPPFALAARGDNGTLLMRVRRLLGTPGTRAHAFPSSKTACGLAGTVILSGAVAAFLLVAGSIPARSQDAAGQATTPAVGAPSTDDKSRRDEVSRLGAATMRGEYEAIEQLAKIAATAKGMNADEKTALYADFRRTFAVFGAEAGRGNATALQTIQRASHLDELEGFAVEALGQAAGMGNAEALKPLLDPENHGILRSSAVAALKPAADAGNVQAIAALAATAADPKQHALWFLAADGLANAAGAGNTTAIDSLAALATDKNLGIRRAAMRALEAAADKGQPAAQQALHKLASTPASSPPSGQTATPAPSPAAPATATLPTALERAWEEYKKVNAEVTRFDQAQQQMKPAESEQEKQQSMAGFLALRDRYHDACAQFVRLAPKEDSRRPLVLLLSTGSDKNATPAEHTAVIDEILATPTAPEEVQAHALALRENTAATAAKISEFLAAHPQEPRRRQLESKVARIRANDPSSPPASPKLPAASPSPGADSSPGLKQDAAENPSPSRPAVSSGSADEPSVPASTVASTDDKPALLDLFRRRGYSIPEGLIDELIATIVHREFGDDRAVFLQAIQARGYTEAGFRVAKREEVIVQAMRQRLVRETQEAKARSIILPKVHVLDGRLADAIELLAAEVRRSNPQVQGMDVRLGAQATQEFKDKKVTLDLENVSLWEVLQFVAQQTHGRMAEDRLGIRIVATTPEQTPLEN